MSKRQPTRKIWRTDANAALEEAARRVAQTGTLVPSEFGLVRVDLRGLDALERLPDLDAVPHLTELLVSRTAVSDLSPLQVTPKLSHLRADGTRISDLKFVRHLPHLRELVVSDTRIQELEPLRACPRLFFLSLSDTPVADLTPIASLSELGWLQIAGTRVTDLSALSGLHRLQDLSLHDTAVSNLQPLEPLAGIGTLRYLTVSLGHVTDWSPLAEHAALSRASVDRPSSQGLRFIGGSDPDVELDRLSRAPAPDATVLFINSLRARRGLKPYWPRKYRGATDVSQGSAIAERSALEVPAQRPAALEPYWKDQKLVLNLPEFDLALGEPAARAASLALQSGLKAFCKDLDDANIDRRFLSFVREFADDAAFELTYAYDLFHLGHLSQAMREYAPIAADEWPAALAARHTALVVSFERLLRSFAAWRAFETNSIQAPLTPVQIEAARPAARELAASLLEDDAREFVDPAVPRALQALAEPANSTPDALPEASSAIRARTADVLESIANILKPIGEAALIYGRNLGEGAKASAKDHGEKDGRRAFTWLRRLAVVGVGAVALPALMRLIGLSPSLSEWLTPLLRLLFKT